MERNENKPDKWAMRIQKAAKKAMNSLLESEGFDDVHYTSDKILFPRLFKIVGCSDPVSKKARTAKLVELYRGKVIAKAPRKQRDRSKSRRRMREQDCFYASPEWLELKKKILHLYGHKCMRCGTTKMEMHVDHILPRSRYESLQLDANNLQVLCRDCNKEKSNKHETDYRTADHLELLPFLLERLEENLKI